MHKIAFAILAMAMAATPCRGASYDDLNVAFSYFNQSQYDNAILWFDKAIAAGDLIPDLARVAYLDRGAIYASKGDRQKADADLTAAIAAKPDDLTAYRERIRLNLANDAPEPALADYETLRKLRPHDYHILLNLGLLNWELGHTEAAAEAFSTFANANSATSWIWLQLSNARLGKPMTKFNESSEGRIWPAEVARFYQGDLPEADVLEKAKSIGTDDAACTAHLLTGLWRAVHQEQEKSVPLLQAAVKKCEENSIYWRIARAELAKAPPGGTSR